MSSELSFDALCELRQRLATRIGKSVPAEIMVDRATVQTLLDLYERETTCARCCCSLDLSTQPKHCWTCPTSCPACDAEGPCAEDCELAP